MCHLEIIRARYIGNVKNTLMNLGTFAGYKYISLRNITMFKNNRDMKKLHWKDHDVNFLMRQVVVMDFF